ncbi:GNAT family N-acetyltransferase [Ruegeria profundi]|nr:GNAT family N-acetyltransferase [Ruegeria profundi]
MELFEQPFPVLRTLLPQDSMAVASLAVSVNQKAIGNLLGELAKFEGYNKFSIIAELDGETVGAMLAYIPPYDRQTLFIWQVYVSEGEAEKGLASLMLGQVMRRDVCADVTRVQTVIPSDDKRNWALFRRFARWQRSRMDIQPFITQALEPFRRHENSNLVTIRLGNNRSELAAGAPLNICKSGSVE